MWQEIEAGLQTAFRGDSTVAAHLKAYEKEVTEGRRSPLSAARALLDAFLKRDPESAPSPAPPEQ